jgi:hypothetical protein
MVGEIPLISAKIAEISGIFYVNQKTIQTNEELEINEM